MLTMIVYSERTVNMNGIETRAGEDAFPFVNGSGMFVADGLGGGAGIRVTQFEPDCFEPEKLAKRLGGCFYMNQYDSESEQIFSEYVKKNFASLANPTMERLYQSPQEYNSRLKKSGYVGSHALGTALAGELILLENQQKRRPLSKDEWTEKAVGVKDGLVARYKDIIRALGAQCPKSNINKIDYFGTTLSAAFFREAETSVDVCFLNCGDSRCYIWDGKGFRQAVDDQGRNGGMTSRFSLTESMEEKEIEISLEYKTYQMPCVLYCMTDGIFSSFSGKDGSHSTPLLMEGRLLQQLVNSETMEEAARKITEIFDKSGQIDDSNSMAVAVFGIKKYDGLRDMARTRLEELYEKYRLNDPDLPQDFLVANYAKALSAVPADMKELLNKAYDTTESVRKYCEGQIRKPEFKDQYQGKIPLLEAQIKQQEESQKRQKYHNTLRALVTENFLTFFSNPGASFKPGSIADTVESMRQKAFQAAEAYDTALNQHAYVMKHMQDAIWNVYKQISKFCAKSNFGSSEEWNAKKVEPYAKRRASTRKDVEKACGGIYKWFDVLESTEKEITQSLESWKAENRNIVQLLDQNGMGVVIDALINKWIEPEGTEHLKSIQFYTVALSIKETLTRLTDESRTIERPIRNLRKDVEAETQKQAHQYWYAYQEQDIGGLLRSDVVFADNPDMKREILERLRRDEDIRKNEWLMKRQKEVFDDYLKDYLRDVTENQRNDVKRNGWM